MDTSDLRQPIHPSKSDDFDYLAAKPPLELVGIQKQAARRHFGVHGYFTKQVWKVVSTYIETFTQPGDLVLDPFGGTGVTLVESLVLGRKSIHIDINPLSIFIVTNRIAPLNINKLIGHFEQIEERFKSEAPTTDSQIARALKTLSYPKGIALPKSSDVGHIEQLFTDRQLAQLAFLKHEILKMKDDQIRDCLLLMLSGLVTKCNRTYHASGTRSAGRGDSAAFRYYRYRIAPRPAEVDMLKYFRLRLKYIIDAQKDFFRSVDKQRLSDATVWHGTATDLGRISDESIDYIYTDPPYGSHIPYLDLSVMWNGWLDLPVSQEDLDNEAIEGGEQNKSKQDYSDLLARSISEMGRVLKYDRWMSFVFAHKDPAYWHLIVESAEKVGFEYAGATPQNNGQTSFKKRQNPFTVLSGQLIINFRKVRNPKTIGSINLGASTMDVILETIESLIAANDGATLEQINSELVIKGLELGFLDVLAKEYEDLTPLLRQSFEYDETHKLYHIKSDRKFKTYIDLELRLRYFLVSYLRRLEHQSQYPTFDDIVLHVMPLLKNGVTPERQTIENVLHKVGERVGENRWRLLKKGQAELFSDVLTRS